MEDKRMYIYEATEFNNIREIIKNAVKKHPENKAFILKEKKDKEIIYKDITYKQFDKDITIYPISDVHLGALEHNADEWEKFIDKIKNEPNSYLILNGDLMNNAKVENHFLKDMLEILDL